MLSTTLRLFFNEQKVESLLTSLIDFIIFKIVTGSCLWALTNEYDDNYDNEEH